MEPSLSPYIHTRTYASVTHSFSMRASLCALGTPSTYHANVLPVHCSYMPDDAGNHTNIGRGIMKKNDHTHPKKTMKLCKKKTRQPYIFAAGTYEYTDGRMDEACCFHHNVPGYWLLFNFDCYYFFKNLYPPFSGPLSLSLSLFYSCISGTLPLLSSMCSCPTRKCNLNTTSFSHSWTAKSWLKAT